MNEEAEGRSRADRDTLGYTRVSRSVSDRPFWTLWDGGAYGAVAVTQGSAQHGRCVSLRCHQLVQQSQKSVLRVEVAMRVDERRGQASGASVLDSSWARLGAA